MGGADLDRLNELGREEIIVELVLELLIEMGAADEIGRQECDNQRFRIRDADELKDKLWSQARSSAPNKVLEK
jgi:hypothetical protein